MSGSGKKEKLSFEEALAGLEKCAGALKYDTVTLEEAMKNYEEGSKYYQVCEKILNEAKQKIEILEGEGSNEGI